MHTRTHTQEKSHEDRWDGDDGDDADDNPDAFASRQKARQHETTGVDNDVVGDGGSDEVCVYLYIYIYIYQKGGVYTCTPLDRGCVCMCARLYICVPLCVFGVMEFVMVGVID